MSGPAVASTLIVLFLLLGVALIHNAYMRNEVDRVNGRLKTILKPNYKQWRVDKQVIIKPKSSNSTEIVRYTPDANRINDLSLPREIRVMITNGSQMYLIGDCDMEDEGEFVRLLAEAEERCSFLNAHEVK